MLPRNLARRFFKPRRNWPRRLAQQVALARASSSLVLFAYELFDLWGSPVVDGVADPRLLRRARSRSTALFKHASFCKFVCPIGQFNFVASTVSPLEVKVRDLDVCDELPHEGLHPRPAREPRVARRHPARLRAGALPAAQGGQPRLHVLPRLRPGLPARQRRHPEPRCPAERAVGRPAALGRRPLLAPQRPVGARRRLHLRRAAQRVRHGQPRLRAARLARRRCSTSSGRRPCSGSLFVLLLVVEPVAPARRGGLADAPWGGARRGAAADRRALLLRARPARLRRLAGALRLSFPDRALHLHPRHAERARRRAGWPVLGEPLWQSRRAARSVSSTPWSWGFWGWGCSARCCWRTASPKTRRRAAHPRRVFAPWAGLCMLLWASGALAAVAADGDARHVSGRLMRLTGSTHRRVQKEGSARQRPGTSRLKSLLLTAGLLLVCLARAGAHEGPPYPILVDKSLGPVRGFGLGRPGRGHGHFLHHP